MLQFPSLVDFLGGGLDLKAQALPMDRLELGKLYFKVVDFESALTSLGDSMAEARAAGDWTQWCRALPLVLRIRAERMEFAQIAELKAELASLQDRGLLTPSSAVNYTLGIAATYESQLDEAADFFTRALAQSSEPHERAQALFGLAAVDSQRRESGRALEKLKQLSEELAPTLLTDLKLAAALLSVFCHRHLGELERAFELLAPLQEICRIEQNLYMSLNILFCYGTLHQARGEKDRARQYFEMVQTLLVPRDLRHLGQQVEEKLKELAEGGAARPALELKGENTIYTAEGRHVPLGNQFILVALLKMLGQSGGRILSKEDICRHLWKEEYNPLVHDNKIYVTIRRLRRMIEPEARISNYILNAPDGYRFNPKIEFRIHA